MHLVGYQKEIFVNFCHLRFRDNIPVLSGWCLCHGGSLRPQKLERLCICMTLWF